MTTTWEPTPPGVVNAISAVCDRLLPDRLHYDAVDLLRLARDLGVVDVLYKASRIHGYTQWGERGATLFLAMAKTEGRRRSTFAHEIGHLLLNPVVAPDATIAVTSRDRSRAILDSNVTAFEHAVRVLGIEKTCDLFAFELLLPRARARALDASELGVATTLAARARSYRISISLLVNQASKAGVHTQLVRLARAWDGKWIAVDTAGTRGSWQTGSTADELSCEQLSALPTGGGSSTISMRCEGAAEFESFSVTRQRATAIAVRQTPGGPLPVATKESAAAPLALSTVGRFSVAPSAGSNPRYRGERTAPRTSTR
jgi:Zn-dependent peptidase ImmA (M78 family)